MANGGGVGGANHRDGQRNRQNYAGAYAGSNQQADSASTGSMNLSGIDKLLINGLIIVSTLCLIASTAKIDQQQQLKVYLAP